MTLAIGVIGAGAIGMEHMARIHHKLVGGKIVAVYDINAENAIKAQQTFSSNIKLYSSAEQLIAAPNIDALIVTSWGPSHEALVLAAIAQGKPVFCEKPLAVTAEGCKKIVQAEMQYGKRLVQVGFMRPFDTTYQQLKATLDRQQIGQPLIVNCKHFNPSVPESYHTPMAVVDTFIHEIDVLRWLLADDYVSARVIYPQATKYTHEKLADPQIIVLETKKGIVINAQIFVNCRYGYDIQCEVIGEEGIACLPEPTAVTLRKQANVSRAILMDWKKRFIEAYDVELQAFLDDVTSGGVTRGATAWDGFAAAITADACVKAQQSGKVEPIEIPETPQFYRN